MKKKKLSGTKKPTVEINRPQAKHVVSEPKKEHSKKLLSKLFKKKNHSPIDRELKLRIKERAKRHKSEDRSRFVKDFAKGKNDTSKIARATHVPENAKEKSGTHRRDILQEIKTKRISTMYQRKSALKKLLGKSGVETSSEKVKDILVKIGVVCSGFFIGMYSTYIITVYGFNFLQLLVSSIVIFLVGTPLVMLLVWLFFYMTLDWSIYKRKTEIETVLADFLELTSTNIRAGMPIDKALWFAVRPRFGVLAKEIETVAKQTLTGKELESALQDFSDKYESKLLARSISLLVEGLRAGSEIGDLLDRIASNIQETRLMNKEMAANVTTYVIFISFATVAGAPFLFGLSYNLVSIIQEITSMMGTGAGGGAVPISMSGAVVKLANFRIFSVVALAINSLFSAMIVSTIQKGNVKAGIKYIPMFLLATIPLYFVISYLFSIMLGGLF